MNEKYALEWSMESIYDLADIEDYISLQFGEQRAIRFKTDIESIDELLSDRLVQHPSTASCTEGF